MPLTMPPTISATTSIRCRNLAIQFAENCGAAAIAPVLLFLFGGSLALKDLAQSFVEASAYAQVIGFACNYAIPRLYPRIVRYGAAWEWPIITVVLLLLSLVGCLAGSTLLVLMRLFSWKQFWPLVQSSARLCVLITLAFGLLATAFNRLRGRLYDEERERQKAELLASQARLASLESRLHPHFLFNAMNSISSLIPVDPKRAERLMERMAELLRFSLDANPHGLVPVERELAIVRDYLEIEQARLGERLRYSIVADDNLPGAMIPPLAVQTLVENSIKHTVAPSRQGGEVRVAVSCFHAEIRVEVCDRGPGFSLRDAPDGHGLDNLSKRLDLLFANTAKLAVQRKDEWTVTSISLPARLVTPRLEAGPPPCRQVTFPYR